MGRFGINGANAIDRWGLIGESETDTHFRRPFCGRVAHWPGVNDSRGTTMRVRYSMALLVGACLVAPLGAADGLVSLFDRSSHDFGNVPIGPMLRTSFTVKNTTNQNLRIVSARVSCGCVTPYVT